MIIAGDWLSHWTPLFMMLGMVAINHAIMIYRAEGRLALEADRLRAALASELQMLADIYRTNIELINRKANYLLSARSPVLVYRHNLGKMTSLFDAALLERLVAHFAQNEIIEAVLAAHAQSKAGVSYQLTAETKVGELKGMYQLALADAQRMQSLLRPGRRALVDVAAMSENSSARNALAITVSR